MPSAFQGIDTVSRALQAFQRGLDMTGHNLANVNTQGYSRQTISYVATDPTNFYGLHRISLGSGVGVASITRVQDMFLQARMLSAQGSMSRFQAKASGLSQVEGVLGGSDNNELLTNLNAFFNSWSSLSANPSDTSLRSAVQYAGSSLAGSVRAAYSGLTDAQANVQTQISQTLARVDELTAGIAKLNNSIRSEVVTGASPNDLMDQRDQMLEELSGLVSIQTFNQSDGTVLVHSGSMPLVDKTSSFPIPKTADTTNFTVSDGSTSYRVLTNSKLYGLFEASNQITAFQSQLDTFAANLRDQVNALHQGGTTGNGATNVDFFASTLPAGVSAAQGFDLSSEVKADVQNIAAGTSGSAGDGGLALSLAQLRDQSNSGLGSITYAQYLTNLITSAGHEVSTANDSVTTQTAIVQQVDQQRQSVSGVSIDDEMANMLRLQRSYQAAAKALSLLDESTKDLINMVQ